ncbi:MAG: arsenate reductase ArsC [Clostridiales bacterium]|nr:arsenate reductase ArsC [Clostridiales bacterium]
MGNHINKKKVLFICTHNSARSQMAEGFLRARYGNDYEVFSAGTEPTAVHPYAVQVMEEVGIDISSHKAKDMSEFIGQEMDEVVTVCDQAREACPFFPYGKKSFHQSFPDPSSFRGSGEEQLAFFRQVRDLIRDWIKKQFGPDKT